MNATITDRREEQQHRESVLKLSVNEEQLTTLMTLERFGWTVKFVRLTLAGPVAVVRDPDKGSLAVIEPDGQLNEDSATVFRP